MHHFKAHFIKKGSASFNVENNIKANVFNTFTQLNSRAQGLSAVWLNINVTKPLLSCTHFTTSTMWLTGVDQHSIKPIVFIYTVHNQRQSITASCYSFYKTSPFTPVVLSFFVTYTVNICKCATLFDTFLLPFWCFMTIFHFMTFYGIRPVVCGLLSDKARSISCSMGTQCFGHRSNAMPSLLCLSQINMFGHCK